MVTSSHHRHSRAKPRPKLQELDPHPQGVEAERHRRWPAHVAVDRHFNRARAYAELKDWQQAIAGYTEAARLFPHDYATHFNLAKARQAVGDLPGAIEGYAKAIELAPGQSDFHLTYGQALELAGRQAEAAAAYKRFLEMQPDGPEADKVKARLSQLGGNAGAAPSTER